MDFTEKTVSSEEIFQGRVVHLYRDVITLPNGHTSTREVIRHQGAVCVVPVTDAGEVLMVRQFRYPFRRMMLEAPAGKVDPGEDPDAAAVRELSEETGATADELNYVGDFYPSVAYTDEVIRLYIAKGLHFSDMHTDEDEFLQLERIPLGELVELVLSGAIPDGKTQTAILKAWLFEQRG